jgi:hypothetical protein
LAHGFGFLVRFTVQVQAYAIGSGTVLEHTGIWLLAVWLLVAAWLMALVRDPDPNLRDGILVLTRSEA